MKNVVMRSFFILIANYAQIKRLKYWVLGMCNFEISRWNRDFIYFYPSHIHFSPTLFKHRPNLPVGKVYTKIYVKISIKYSIVISAAEPTSLPFLGSRRLPFDIVYFLSYFWGCVIIDIKKSGNPHKHWILAFPDFPKNNRIWVLILTHAQKQAFLGTFWNTHKYFWVTFSTHKNKGAFL